MKIKSSIRGGRIATNHNATKSVKIKSGVRGGRLAANHNGTKIK